MSNKHASNHELNPQKDPTAVIFQCLIFIALVVMSIWAQSNGNTITVLERVLFGICLFYNLFSLSNAVREDN